MKTIQGTKPYLTFKGGKTKTHDIEGLLSIALFDGSQYIIDDNPSSVTNPIEMPKSYENHLDIG